MKYLAIVPMGLLGACLVNAQEFQRFTFDAGAGFTQPVGNTERHLDTGWNAGFGAGMNFTNRLGAMVQFNYNAMNINSATLNNIGVPGGNVSIWSLTLDPRVHLLPKGPVDVYLVGGGGLYHRTQEFTAPTVATTLGFDPFFGNFFPVAIPANTILASSTVNKPGFNVGAGVALGTKWHAKFFAEARWHHMFIDNVHDDWVPVTFGVTF
jgi:opacity protein-like surface antigen